MRARYSSIEEEIEEGQEDDFKSHLTRLEKAKAEIHDLRLQIREINELLNHLHLNYEFVTCKTQSLQGACEQLLDEQKHLVALSNDISSKMTYFQELEYISKALNQPGEELVQEPHFKDLLTKLDECLEFVSTHPKYKESAVFQMRYRQCMTRSLTLIKLYFVESLRNLQTEVKEKIAARDSNEPLPANIQLSLFYVKFKSLASKTQHLIAEIESRCINHPEYFALLRDCITNLTSVRKNLLSPYITQNIKSKNSDSSLISFASNGSAYMLRICADEYQLCRDFFQMGEEEIRLYIEDISSLLSWQLRPLILKETRLDLLAELCNALLFHLKKEDQESGEVQADNADGEIIVSKSEAVKFIVESILYEAQSRLSFRAQEYIHNDIRRFHAREKELLVLARGPDLPQPANITSLTGVASVLDDVASPFIARRSSSIAMDPNAEAVFSNSGEHELATPLMNNTFGGGEWFPTLQRTVNLITKLHSSLPGPSFVDLAQDAVDACIISISNASETLSALHGAADGQLFIIKNLLQLRESISLYDSRFTRLTRTVKLTEIFQAIREVLGNPLALQNYGNLVTPFIATQQDDIRQILDAKLKASCESFILDTSKSVSQPILEYMKVVNDFLSRNSRGELYLQPFTTKEHLVQVYESFINSIQTALPPSIKKLKQYLGDKSTQLTLIRIIRASILSQATEFQGIAKHAEGGTVEEIVNEIKIAAELDKIFSS